MLISSGKQKTAWQDFCGVDTSLLIKYMKTYKAREPFYVNDDKKVTKREGTVFIIPIIREGNVLKTLLTMVKLKALIMKGVSVHDNKLT